MFDMVSAESSLQGRIVSADALFPGNVFFTYTQVYNFIHRFTSSMVAHDVHCCTN